MSVAVEPRPTTGEKTPTNEIRPQPRQMMFLSSAADLVLFGG